MHTPQTPPSTPHVHDAAVPRLDKLVLNLLDDAGDTEGGAGRDVDEALVGRAPFNHVVLGLPGTRARAVCCGGERPPDGCCSLRRRAPAGTRVGRCVVRGARAATRVGGTKKKAPSFMVLHVHKVHVAHVSLFTCRPSTDTSPLLGYASYSLNAPPVARPWREAAEAASTVSGVARLRGQQRWTGRRRHANGQEWALS